MEVRLGNCSKTQCNTIYVLLDWTKESAKLCTTLPGKCIMCQWWYQMPNSTIMLQLDYWLTWISLSKSLQYLSLSFSHNFPSLCVCQVWPFVCMLYCQLYVPPMKFLFEYDMNPLSLILRCGEIRSFWLQGQYKAWLAITKQFW